MTEEFESKLFERLDGIEGRLDRQSHLLNTVAHHVVQMRKELIDLRTLGLEQESAIADLLDKEQPET